MKPRKVYIAGRWSKKGEIAVFANKVKELGYLITARWLAAGDEKNGPISWKDYAKRDEQDIYDADIFILFTETDPPERNSRLVELGYALAYAKEVIIVGPIETIFCTLADEIYATEADCLIGLENGH